MAAEGVAGRGLSAVGLTLRPERRYVASDKAEGAVTVEGTVESRDLFPARDEVPSFFESHDTSGHLKPLNADADASNSRMRIVDETIRRMEASPVTSPASIPF